MHEPSICTWIIDSDKNEAALVTYFFLYTPAPMIQVRGKEYKLVGYTDELDPENDQITRSIYVKKSE